MAIEIEVLGLVVIRDRSPRPRPDVTEEEMDAVRWPAFDLDENPLIPGTQDVLSVRPVGHPDRGAGKPTVAVPTGILPEVLRLAPDRGDIRDGVRGDPACRAEADFR